MYLDKGKERNPAQAERKFDVLSNRLGYNLDAILKYTVYMFITL